MWIFIKAVRRFAARRARAIVAAAAVALPLDRVVLDELRRSSDLVEVEDAQLHTELPKPYADGVRSQRRSRNHGVGAGNAARNRLGARDSAPAGLGARGPFRGIRDVGRIGQPESGLDPAAGGLSRIGGRRALAGHDGQGADGESEEGPYRAEVRFHARVSDGMLPSKPMGIHCTIRGKALEKTDSRAF